MGKFPLIFGNGLQQAVSALVDATVRQQPHCKSCIQQGAKEQIKPVPSQRFDKGRAAWRRILGGKYEVDLSDDGVLGEGTSCICYRGRIVETGVSVAVKVYKFDESSFSKLNRDACLRKLRRSVSVMEQLQESFERPCDPKLWNSQLDGVKPSNLFVRLIDYSRDASGQPGYDPVEKDLIVVTELAQYSLKDFLAKRRKSKMPPSKETVRSVTKAILLVMAGLHAKCFVHLDMKPENLMFFDGRLKLIDVDGCVAIGTSISRADSSISFSPCYCAPEWANFVIGAKDARIPATPGLDTWSVGCTICELITLEAMLSSTYSQFSGTSSARRAKLEFLEWLTNLEEAPLPPEVDLFDSELTQLMTSCLLVCRQSERRTCAESLDAPYLASRRVQRTKSSPIRVQAYEENDDEDESEEELNH